MHDFVVVLSQVKSFLPMMQEANSKLEERLRTTPAEDLDIENIQDCEQEIIEMVRYSLELDTGLKFITGLQPEASYFSLLSVHSGLGTRPVGLGQVQSYRVFHLIKSTWSFLYGNNV